MASTIPEMTQTLYTATPEEGRTLAQALAERALRGDGTKDESVARLAAIEFATIAAANHYWEGCRGAPSWAARH